MQIPYSEFLGDCAVKVVTATNCCINYSCFFDGFMEYDYYIIIVIEFFTSQLWLGNIHLSWEVVINTIRLVGPICSLKSFLQLNMCQELQIFAVVYMYSGAS